MKNFFEHLSMSERMNGLGGWVWGWCSGLVLLDASTFWGYAIKGFGVFVTSGIGAIGAIVATKFYKKYEPKTLKFFKSKFKKHGKDKRA